MDSVGRRLPPTAWRHRRSKRLAPAVMVPPPARNIIGEEHRRTSSGADDMPTRPGSPPGEEVGDHIPGTGSMSATWCLPALISTSETTVAIAKITEAHMNAVPKPSTCAAACAAPIASGVGAATRLAANADRRCPSPLSAHSPPVALATETINGAMVHDFCQRVVVREIVDPTGIRRRNLPQTRQTSAPAVRIVDIAVTSDPQTMSGGVAANRMTGRSQRPGKASNGQAEIGRKRRVWDFRHYRSNVSNRTVDHTSRRRSGSPEQRGTRVNCRTKPRFLESADQFALSIGSCGRRNSSGAQTGMESEGRLAGMPSLVRCRQRCGPSPWERSRQGGCR